ncbi:hypothetical protein [Clostridium polynesiense]|uniref:hypothetical protein n=1 Tax=Clostridium polynesiense TaxID=1325933 RepID=UPI00058F8C93|nr:hypothetical protein [Clostridium polynesiense]
MIIKSIMFKRDENSRWEKGLSIEDANNDEKLLFLDKDLNVMGMTIYDSVDTNKYKMIVNL